MKKRAVDIVPGILVLMVLFFVTLDDSAIDPCCLFQKQDRQYTLATVAGNKLKNLVHVVGEVYPEKKTTTYQNEAGRAEKR